MALTIRREQRERLNEADLVGAIPTPETSFDPCDLIAVAGSLAKSVEDGLAERDDCARELSAWANGDRIALELAARSPGGQATGASSLLRSALACTSIR